MASGLLVIALGEATKIIPYLETQKVQKEYLFSIKWGVKTDTDDITGNIIEQGGIIPEKDKITGVFTSFIGLYNQMPPAFSAKKINGIPAYKLARKGVNIELKPKNVNIYELEETDIDGIYRVLCSEGTYVRTLVTDIAARLGTIATCSMIRRTATNGFSIKECVTLDFLENLSNNADAVMDFLKPLDFGLVDIPVAKLEPDDAMLFINGGFVPCKDAGQMRVYSENKFIGIGMAEQGVLKPKRIINADK